VIAIIDYGSGNINAIKNIYRKNNIACKFATKAQDLVGATKIILPGVGAFDSAMSNLNRSGMREALDSAVLEDKLPVLGVCVGMHIMTLNSEEGELAGLGWINAEVKLLDVERIAQKPKIPHMGWNSIETPTEHPLFNGIDKELGFYFLHSYYVHCQRQHDIMATAQYGKQFHCAFNRENIFGVQFHPEKSHSNGIDLFNNFSEL